MFIEKSVSTLSFSERNLVVSKSIDEGLLNRIQVFVANHITSRKLETESGELLEVAPEEVYILAFSRILGNWQAVAAIEDFGVGYYQMSHDGAIGQTIYTVYFRAPITGEAVL